MYDPDVALQDPLATQEYDAYGVVLDASSDFSSLQYSGEWTDTTTGLQYLRARYYDPATGRFNRLDPFAGFNSDPLSLHKYLYVSDDPIQGADPSGLFGVISVGSASSLGASLQGQIGTAGHSVLETVQDSIVNGVGVDQALKNFAFSLLFDQFGVAAIGATIGVASKALVFSGQKVVGFARVAGGISLPGTIISRTRLIPGSPGTILGGTSQLLKRNLLEASGINRSIAAKGFQAHHIIPSELGRRSHPVLKKIGIDLDNATNGILLPNAIHTGHHPAYTKAIAEALDRIPATASVQQTMQWVYGIQSKAAQAFIEHGASLRGGSSSSLLQWRKMVGMTNYGRYSREVNEVLSFLEKQGVLNQHFVEASIESVGHVIQSLDDVDRFRDPDAANAMISGDLNWIDIKAGR